MGGSTNREIKTAELGSNSRCLAVEEEGRLMGVISIEVPVKAR